MTFGRRGSKLAVAAVLGTFGLIGGIGCGAELTREEAADALEEAQVSSQAEALTSSSVEISTNFTIGGAVEAAAAELRTFVETQLPCAQVTLTGATLSIEYGARPGSCTYRGQTYHGTHTIAVMRNEMSDVVVNHTWTAFQNDQVSVTGSATVTWSFANRTRHVVHELTWTRLSDGRMGTGRGDRTQQPLTGGLIEGFSVDGTRSWDGASGHWALDIDSVEMRWIDPVPQSGTYTLDTPYGAAISMSFLRVSPTGIQVTIDNGRRTYQFTVLTAPAG